MDELIKRSDVLQNAFRQAAHAIKLEDRARRLNQLEADMQQPDFWQDSTKAQASSKEAAGLKARLEPWLHLENELQDLGELMQTRDTTLINDLTAQLKTLEQSFDDLKEQLKFKGPYDDHNAILTIWAGAGGTDAQDWTQMLFRMYARWAEKRNLKTTLIEESAGEEAGLKRVTLEIEGPFVFGKLKGEHGVHRLVRLSPFNADNLRQTSFAKVDVLPMIDKPEELEIDSKDLKIDVFRAGGHGGQSVNTTDSAVRVTHLPTNIVVSIQNERSQLQNKETAMTILRSRLAQMQLEQHRVELNELKGPNESAEWGNQIRSYVLHPYKQVKDLRTRFESSDPESILNGDIDSFIDAYLEYAIMEHE